MKNTKTDSVSHGRPADTGARTGYQGILSTAAGIVTYPLRLLRHNGRATAYPTDVDANGVNGNGSYNPQLSAVAEAISRPNPTGAERPWHEVAGEYIAQHWKPIVAAGVLIPAVAIVSFGKKLNATPWDVYSHLTKPRAAATERAPADVIERNTSGQIQLPDGRTVQIAEPASTPTPTPNAEARYPTATIEPSPEPTPTAPATAPAPAAEARYPTVAPAQPTPKTYWKTYDGLAGLECRENCNDELVEPYLRKAYQTAVSEGNKPFNGIVADAFEYRDGKLVKIDGKKWLRRAEGEGLILEMECGPVDAIQCDSKTVERITKQSKDAYDFIVAALQPSKNVGIYVTVSRDGTRANVTYILDSKRLPRASQTAFYPWHVTDDFGQMRYEMGVTFDRRLGYTGEAPLTEFLGHWTAGGTGEEYTRWRLPQLISGTAYSKNRLESFDQQRIAIDVDILLTHEGIIGDKRTQLMQRLEGKQAKWEQFKAEAKAVAGRNLPTLDYIDEGVRLWREMNKQSGAVINDRSSALARILEENLGLNTPAYIKTYWEQFA